MSSLRRGFTFHELLVSLVVTSVVFTVATLMAREQMRFFRGISDVTALRAQLGQSTEILRNALWSVSPGDGELLLAQDSAIEIRLLTGMSVVCDAAPGAIILPGPSTTAENPIAFFVRAPEPGDRVSALFSDSLGVSWLNLRVASPPVSDESCALLQGADVVWSMSTIEPLDLPAGTPLRFTRPIRFSLYRSSDSRWYLGARDWNGELQRYNTIQPVAGPLQRFSDDSATGLRFLYRDRAGVELPAPVDPGRVSAVEIVARAATPRPVRIRGLRRDDVYRDSSVAFIRLRNAR